MPRNRAPVDRTEKRAEIVTAATRLFVDDGYDNTTMGKIAAAAGVTANTIYWYFRDKDQLLIGVLDDVHAQTLIRFTALGELPLGDRILWAVRELTGYHRLVDTVHVRKAQSPEIDDWHNAFHSTWEGWLASNLTLLGVSEADIEPMTRVIVFVIESMLTHPNTELENRATVDVLLRMVDPPTS
ncbi:TetR/AcrR family transcriptional regulator [Rhodococcus sp. USK13]|uniref:TetR/AcrR family transcriptional regulator n=1 Tax=Rhodococcus sp. USK13 TaxID=2806442 RepID=UPI001BCEE4B2|nr:TetR/AcrR family transcriptional regulator [Rhodococcus sp. USK13]